MSYHRCHRLSPRHRSFLTQALVTRSPLHCVADFLGAQLENYVSRLPVPVEVLRTGERSGLIRARLMGAKQARGQVITFLDAHCECTEGWLEAMLARIAENR